MRVLLGLCLLVALSWAGTVRAQLRTAAVLPAVGGHREIPAEVRDEARRAAIEFLRVEDLIVLDDSRLMGLTPEQRACTDLEACGNDVRNALGVDLVVALVVWGRDDDPSRPESVHAVIQDALARYTGTATAPQGVATAVRDALRNALRDQRRGPGPFLRVEGTRGAVCELDGRAIGAIPLTVRVTPGEHRLRVRLEGYEPQTLTVAIGDDDPARVTQVEVNLRRSGEGGGGASGGDAWPSWLLAGGLFAGAVALAVPPIWTLATDGECVRQGAHGCLEWVHFDAGMGVALGVSGALLVGAVVVAITQPITLRASASTQGASLVLEGRF